MKATTIRTIFIVMSVIFLAGFVVIEHMFYNTLINLIYICLFACVYAVVGTYLVDYMQKYDLTKAVLGETLYDIILNIK